MDNQSALTIATALSSKGDSSNHLAAEISLLLETLHIEALDPRHWRNTINIEADALSRLSEGKPLPRRLQGLPRDEIQCTLGLFELKRWPVPSPVSQELPLSRLLVHVDC